MNPVLELNNVAVALEGTVIVHDISLQLREGMIGCLLGPSGCGKTTLLRAIAGFEKALEGEIRIAGSVVSNQSLCLPVEKRQVGMVFQDYALFPHLSVAENIAFGLSGKSSSEKKARVMELAQMLKISEYLHTYPHRLSGGQQQRVAVARAMAPKPRILLLDEPFASLDVELREELAREIRYVLKQDGITAILVSHNQYEAFAMADEIGVMRSGELMQWSTPFDLYHTPSCPYVAEFVGEGVFLNGTVSDANTVLTALGPLSEEAPHGYELGSTVMVLIRPDDVIHDDYSSKTAKVIDKAFRGSQYLYRLELADGTHVLSLVPSHHCHGQGEMIGIHIEMDHLVAFKLAK